MVCCIILGFGSGWMVLLGVAVIGLLFMLFIGGYGWLRFELRGCGRLNVGFVGLRLVCFVICVLDVGGVVGGIACFAWGVAGVGLR